jgi:hypothetical protein
LQRMEVVSHPVGVRGNVIVHDWATDVVAEEIDFVLHRTIDHIVLQASGNYAWELQALFP